MSETPTTHLPQPASQSEAAPRPPRAQSILTRILWAALVLAMATVIAFKIFEPRRLELPVLYQGATFALLDQNAAAFSNANLRGKPYICDFVFTTCGSVCPMMSAKMLEIQKQTPEKVQLVSFSVNPKFDTPPVLKEYAKRFSADESRWHFLTGTPEQLHQVAKDSHVAVEDATPDNPIFHDEHFLLIDGDGNCRGVYSSNDPQAISRLVQAARYLAKTRGAR
jgi:protein SCO1/2